MKIGILGGGLTGLTIASQLNQECEVLEKNSECGGLCRSLQENGFTFDYGGAHIIFSRDPKPVEFMLNLLGDNVERNRRNNKVYFKGKFIKYPFENGLSYLDKEDTFDCLYYYLINNYKKAENFKEWIYFTFGKGIAEKYLIPYNEKIWNFDTSKMSLHWVEGRIPKPPVEDVIKSALGIETEGYTHQLYYHYPKTGGIQALIRSLEKKIPNITKNFEVKKVEKKGKKWVVSNNEVEKEFDRIISTIPLFSLIRAIDSVPKHVQDAVESLKYNSLITVMLGINKPSINDFTAIYFPDSDFLPNRVAFPMNFSKENTPFGMSSVVAEITADASDKVWKFTDDQLIEHVIQGLHIRKIIDKNDVIYSKVRRSNYAYVIYDLDYQRNIATVKNYFRHMGIDICGRFAEFEYLNMDACIDRSFILANSINSNLIRKG
jgi:protoporphyrinogen oxidase